MGRELTVACNECVGDAVAGIILLENPDCRHRRFCFPHDLHALQDADHSPPLLSLSP